MQRVGIKGEVHLLTAACAAPGCSEPALLEFNFARHQPRLIILTQMSLSVTLQTHLAYRGYLQLQRSDGTRIRAGRNAYFLRKDLAWLHPCLDGAPLSSTPHECSSARPVCPKSSPTVPAARGPCKMLGKWGAVLIQEQADDAGGRVALNVSLEQVLSQHKPRSMLEYHSLFVQAGVELATLCEWATKGKAVLTRKLTEIGVAVRPGFGHPRQDMSRDIMSACSL